MTLFNQTIIPNLSLFIPRVFINWSEHMIADVFRKLSLGKVSYVKLVSHIGSNNIPYNNAYIYFDYWYNNTAAINFQKRVLNPNQDALLIYDEPWHWIVEPNKNQLSNIETPKSFTSDKNIYTKFYINPTNTSKKSNKRYERKIRLTLDIDQPKICSYEDMMRNINNLEDGEIIEL